MRDKPRPLSTGVLRPSPASDGTSSRVGWNIARFAVATLLIVWLTKSEVISWEAVGRLFSAWPLAVLALILFLIDFGVTSYRTCVLLRPGGFDLSPWDALRLGAVANLFTIVLPAAGGDVARMFYAAGDAAGRRFEVATLLLLDRVLGLLAMLLLPLLTIPFYIDLVARSRSLQVLLFLAAGGSIALASGLAIAVVSRARHSRTLRWVLTVLPLRGYLERFLDTVHAFRGNLGALVISLGLSLVAHALSVSVLWLLVAITSQQPPPASVGFLAALGFVANSVPLTPNGIGIGEVAFDRLFSLAGVHTGAEALLCWRLLILALVPPGLIVYLGGRRRFFREQQVTMPL